MDQPIPGGLLAPPGIKPDFLDPYTVQPYIKLCLALCIVLSTVFVLLRMYTKIYITRSPAWEDYASVAAWLGLIGYSVIALVSLKDGLGIHQWDVPITSLMDFAKLANAEEILYGPVIFATKLSILLQYLRIFVPHRGGKFFYFTQILIWGNLAFYIAITMLWILECVPRTKIWNPLVSGHCVNANYAFAITAAINILSDFSILLLPLASIWSLQMPVRRKIGVSAVFAAGLFACVSSILRLVYSVQIFHNADDTYIFVPINLWSYAEITTGILCGCLPVLPQFFRTFVPKIASYLSYRSRSKATDSSNTHTNSASKKSTPWQDPYSPQERLKGSYLELEERDLSDSRSTIVPGERGNPSDQISRAGNGTPYEIHDVEKAASSTGIRKTVHVELHPEQLPAVHHGSSLRMNF